MIVHDVSATARGSLWTGHVGEGQGAGLHCGPGGGAAGKPNLPESSLGQATIGQAKQRSARTCNSYLLWGGS